MRKEYIPTSIAITILNNGDERDDDDQIFAVESVCNSNLVSELVHSNDYYNDPKSEYYNGISSDGSTKSNGPKKWRSSDRLQQVSEEEEPIDRESVL